LSLRKISLPLHASLASSMYICCIVQSQEEIIETTPSIVHCLSGQQPVEKHFKVEKVFNNLQADFELKVHFYQMSTHTLKPVKGVVMQMGKQISKLRKLLVNC